MTEDVTVIPIDNSPMDVVITIKAVVNKDLAIGKTIKEELNFEVKDFLTREEVEALVDKVTPVIPVP